MVYLEFIQLDGFNLYFKPDVQALIVNLIYTSSLQAVSAELVVCSHAVGVCRPKQTCVQPTLSADGLTRLSLPVQTFRPYGEQPLARSFGRPQHVMWTA